MKIEAAPGHHRAAEIAAASPSRSGSVDALQQRMLAHRRRCPRRAARSTRSRPCSDRSRPASAYGGEMSGRPPGRCRRRRCREHVRVVHLRRADRSRRSCRRAFTPIALLRADDQIARLRIERRAAPVRAAALARALQRALERRRREDRTDAELLHLLLRQLAGSPASGCWHPPASTP